ncbi:TVP38/TMEM64 family protein [Salinigranum marinum]|uniref:TVP38/TMEM64 family protein n=1 Tax=Salinigranum marinum TaxID=1515595 RepID=UPI002989E545|nr:TVP38/TMEM64 family protein [Salinigranum marinum]
MDTALDRSRIWFGNTQVFASSGSRRRFFVHLLALGLAFVFVTTFVHRRFGFLTDAQALREFIRGYGILAPGVLVVLQTVQVVAAPIPGQVLAVVAGYLFGAWWGTLYNMIGITMRSTIAFWISRRYGRASVENTVHEEALNRFDAVSDDYGQLALFFFFLVPGLPDDVTCFAGGLTNIPLWQLVVLAIIGRAPAFFLVNAVGDLLGTDQFPAAVVLAVVLVVISAVGYRKRDLLTGFSEGICNG